MAILKKDVQTIHVPIEIIDYNGTGRWSLISVQERYVAHATRLNVPARLDLVPMVHDERMCRWIYPIMFQVIEGIEQGDKACIAIGIEMLEEDGLFSFGKIIKSKNARALRRATLDTGQAERVRKRVAHMFVEGRIPHEFREYSKLMRKVGIGDWWPFMKQKANVNNPYVLRFYQYFEQHVISDQS